LECLEGRDHLKDLDIDGRIILKWILKNQDRDQWQDLVSTAINLWLP
jgi:hypothetical protein